MAQNKVYSRLLQFIFILVTAMCVGWLYELDAHRPARPFGLPRPTPPDTILPKRQDTPTVEKPIKLLKLAQDRYGDPFSQYGEVSILQLLNGPNSMNFKIEPDSTGDFYTIHEKVGAFNYRPISVISKEDFFRWRNAKINRDYYKLREHADDAVTDTTGSTPRLSNKRDKLLPDIKLPPMLSRVIGGDLIEINPTGSVLLDFGGLWQRLHNPQLPIFQQRNGGFVFDQRIQFALNGKIGDKINLNTNLDTKASFQFENFFNQGYSGYEEDIIQQLQFGNVSMGTSNSLITGAQNIFGITSKLRFGKLWLTTVAASSRGTTETMLIRNGAQTKNFELRADKYEFNRNFFLGQFFRDNYERSLRTTPVITSGVQITRLEVYITNRNNNTQTLRNVAAFMDLGEGRAFRASNPQVGGIPGAPAANGSNELFKNVKGNERVRDADQIHSELEGSTFNLQRGTDYELLRAARLLTSAEYSFDSQLGFITLVQPLRNDEILAVSYEYTFNGKVYKVGEMTEDYQNYPADKNLILKMLKPSTIRTDLPVWNLMMKNIYPLQANQLVKNNFQLRVVYRDDISGLDNPNLQEGIRTQNVPLLQLMGLDRLNPNNDPQKDGNFDFIEGITIDSRNARIIFPVVEPFGSTLKSYFDPNSEQDLINKYVYGELYSKTQADAVLFSDKSKFFLKGSYQSGASNEITLNGLNIAPNSVIVKAGNSILTEGTDYTVDYQFGRVRILNEGIMSSGKDITIQYERADLFSFQQRTVLGMEAEYRLSEKTKLTGTVLHLNERPVITRINMGNEPIRNTLWGFTYNTKQESGLLTRLVDKIPFVDTKEKSNYAFNAEFAQLIPGANRLIRKNGGTSYVDDFESTEIPYDLTRQPLLWRLGSTPSNFIKPEDYTKLTYNYKRARLNWYSVDYNAFYNRGTVGLGQVEPNIPESHKNNHYIRLIPFNEIFKGRDAQQINFPEITLDLLYYPDEVGQYNYNTNLTSEGLLSNNPRENFGAITKGITYDVDFDNINVQYIEFWMMDPFLEGPNGVIQRDVNGQKINTNNTTGGKLKFHLGNISEDVIPDSRHGFENGLPVNDEQQNFVDTTIWGRVTTQQFITDAFSAESGARTLQDVGLDGLNNAQEAQQFASYLETVQPRLNTDVFRDLQRDPSRDDFKYYLGDEQNKDNALVFERYTNYNNYENNSPENSLSSSSTFPDNEDLNRDNTLNDLEGYYEYDIDLRPDNLGIGLNPYVVDQVTNEVNGDAVTWYQFRIPIRENFKKIGAIDGFKSMRFLRTVLTDWEQPVALRMAYFQFVGAQWRPYFTGLQQPGLYKPLEPYNPVFTVSSINIEENAQPDKVGDLPYVLPPGFTRDVDPTSITGARLNEQSIKVCVEGLQDTDSRAIFRNVVFDFINYKRLQMFIHADSKDALDGEVSAFIRLGTDFKENYYEVEIPLTMSQPNASTALDIWPEVNNLDIEFDRLIDVKAERNNRRLSANVPFQMEVGKYKITVVGNPDLSSVQVVMLGVRNPFSADELPKSACLWFNELRVADFRREGGWAANARFTANLADFATVNASLRYSTPWFGGLQSKLAERTRETSLYYDISSNIQLDKIFLNRLGISLPMYVSYERNRIVPLFNPLDPDTRLERSLERFDTQEEKQDYRNLVLNQNSRRSVNFTNVRKTKVKENSKAHFWDIENLTLNTAWTQSRASNTTAAEHLIEDSRLGLDYSYTFAEKYWRPFKKNELLNSPYLKWLRDFNLNLTPNTVNVSGLMNRHYTKTQLRSADLTTNGMTPFYEKFFLFDRNYAARWNLTEKLGFEYSAVANSVIDEPEGDRELRQNRDSVWANILKLGRMKTFTQNTAFTYTLPLDKFPLTDWINADLRYASGITWNAGAVGIADSLGHVLGNSSNTTLNGQFNMQKLYEKSPTLKAIIAPKSKKTMVYKQEKKKRLQTRLQRLDVRIKRNETKRQTKLDERKNKLTENLKKTLPDSVTTLPAVPSFSDTLFADIQTKHNKRRQKYEERKKKLNEKVKALTEKQKAKAAEAPREVSKTTTALANALFSVKKINFSYTDQASTTIPGYMFTPSYFGMDNNLRAPGLGFVMGGQNRSHIQKMLDKEWLSKSEAQNYQLIQNRNRTLTLRTTIEPIKLFVIDLEAQLTQGDNYSEVIRYDQATGRYQQQTPMRNGSYSMTFLSLPTAFTGDDRRNNSPVFQKMIDFRRTFKTQLDAQNPNGEHNLNSQDVLIPSFLAAYTGRSASSVKNGAFPRIPLPNWKINYTGLTKIPSLQEVFSSFAITHAYTSLYNVGNYTSSLIYDPSFVNLDVSLYNLPEAIVNPETGELVPIFVMNQVSIRERFAPLIGINMRTKSDFNIRLNYNRERMAMLNLTNAQITEQHAQDITAEVGVRKKGVIVPFSGGYKLPNDLDFRVAFTLRDSRTVQRKISDTNKQDNVITAGNFNLQFRPTLAYTVNKLINLTAYFERNINTPRISNSFKRTSTAFGIQMRFNITN
ncbi:MAG: cell surface protein SprA [Cytophagales bacterium]|nr:MAG: cell surface protein SprA [Cytophagales bacterium]TAF59840.1 MAG: cell surface protein SprA [Cytophagales bacterium]